MLATMLVDYWLACKIGRLRSRMRPAMRLRPLDTGLPGLCRRVASGEQLPAGLLRQAQWFAVACWQWLAGLLLVLMLAVGILLSVVHRVHPAASVLSGLFVALLFLLAAAMSQSVMAIYRVGKTRNYLRQSDFEARDRILPLDSGGLPRRADFWGVLVAAEAVTAVLALAGGVFR